MGSSPSAHRFRTLAVQVVVPVQLRYITADREGEYEVLSGEELRDAEVLWNQPLSA